MTGLELGAAIARRETSSVEVTRAFLDRIAALDGEVGAFVSLRGDALRDAAARDAEPSRGPFHGVPIGVKDLDVVGGGFTRFGSRATRWFWSPFDGPVAKSLRAAGFVLVGKTATSEFGAMSVTETDIGPPARNPWDLSRSPGGSSGGAAAAVSAGLLPLAQGSDGGGSIRIPAAFCHLYGFKPSRASMASPYAAVDPLDLAFVGPLAHTVADAAALSDVFAGRRPLAVPRSTPRALRVRFSSASVMGETDPAIAAAVRETAALLQSLGHDVVEAPPMEGSLDEFLPIWQYQVASIKWVRESLLQPATRWLREEGRRHTLVSVQARRADMVARVREWLGDADLWLLPSVAVAPPPVGASNALNAEAQFRWAAQFGSTTALFNLTGQPAASVPVGLSPAGLPIGVQVIGNTDADVLDVSAQLEEARPWRQRRSPLALR